MRRNRGIVRGAALLLGGVIALTALAGCARTAEVDIAEELAKDPSVASVDLVPGSSPEHYEITVDDELDADELVETTERLWGITETVADDDGTFSVRDAAWSWDIRGSEKQSTARAEAVAALQGIDGVYDGSVGVSEDGLFVTIVSAAGVDPSSLVTPVVDAAAAAELPEPVHVDLTDLHDRLTIDGDVSRVEPKIAAVQAAASVGEIQQYLVTESALSVRMRTADGAAAATPAIQSVMEAAGGSGIDVPFGIVGPSTGVFVPGSEAEAAVAPVERLLAPMPGIADVLVEQRSRDIAVLIVRTADVQTAIDAQQALLADPATLQPYRSLQFTVENADRPGTSLRALSTGDTGHVGNLERAIQLAETDGILGEVLVTPSKLEATLARDVDVATVATALKAAAIRDQEAEVFGALPHGLERGRPAYSFDVLGKLHPDLIDGYGDKKAFVDAWNDAPGL